MIVDLVRNDLGRFAEVGSVRVAQDPQVMNLDYVHHTFYEVACKPRPQTTIRDWLGASFPPGSITGAPKIEVMKLLQDLEGGERGPYCGCFGWLASAAVPWRWPSAPCLSATGAFRSPPGHRRRFAATGRGTKS